MSRPAPPRVLFISANRIGDCVISSGIIREILRQVPDARITLVHGRPASPLFRAAPGIEHIILFDKKPLGLHWFDIWRKTVGVRWTMVVDIRGSGLAWLLRAGRRRVYHRGLERGDPKVALVGRLIEAPAPPEPEIFLDDKARADADKVLDGISSPILALAPIAHHPGKSWPKESWARLVQRLKADPCFDGWRFMLVGGPADRPSATPALKAAGARGIDFVGKGDILASAAAIGRAALFVGNDSGLMHVAAAAGRPTLGLFGPTEWWLYGPWGPKTRTAASNETRGQFAPIEDLSVDHVFDAVLRLHDDFIGPDGVAKP